MTLPIVLGLAAAGGVGAAARFVVDGLVRQLSIASRFPLATLFINVIGSLVIGVLAGLVLRGVLDPSLRIVFATGFCGGFTTFGTASVETVRLLLERRRRAAALYALGSLVLAGFAAALGTAIGRA